jgi:hypothetical protein
VWQTSDHIIPWTLFALLSDDELLAEAFPEGIE